MTASTKPAAFSDRIRFLADLCREEPEAFTAFFCFLACILMSFTAIFNE